MKITPQYLKGLITQAIDNGASSSEIEELEDYLAQIKSGKLNRQAGQIFTDRRVDCQGRTIIYMSTAPITDDTDDDFADLTLKPIRHKPQRN